jgi:hypothetical protein
VVWYDSRVRYYVQVNHSGRGGLATAEAIAEALAKALPTEITVEAYMPGDEPGVYEIAYEEKRSTRGNRDIKNGRPDEPRSASVGG